MRFEQSINFETRSFHQKQKSAQEIHFFQLSPWNSPLDHRYRIPNLPLCTRDHFSLFFRLQWILNPLKTLQHEILSHRHVWSYRFSNNLSKQQIKKIVDGNALRSLCRELGKLGKRVGKLGKQKTHEIQERNGNAEASVSFQFNFSHTNEFFLFSIPKSFTGKFSHKIICSSSLSKKSLHLLHHHRSSFNVRQTPWRTQRLTCSVVPKSASNTSPTPIALRRFDVV